MPPINRYFNLSKNQIASYSVGRCLIDETVLAHFSISRTGLRSGELGQYTIKTHSDDKNRAQHVPPIDDRTHFRIAFRPRRVNLRHWDLGRAIAKLQQL